MLERWLAKRATFSVPAPISIPPSGKFEGNDGPWSSFPIQIGTPPQTVNVLISTASSQTWAIDPQGCVAADAANCSTSRGGFFQSNLSSTWTENQDAAGGLFPLVLETDLNVTGNASYGYDTITLGGQGSDGRTLNQQVVAGIATKAFYQGFFGLNPKLIQLPETTAPLPDYMTELNLSYQIPSLSWSYTAGNQYRPGPVHGSLILGGYDSSRFTPNEFTFPFNETASRDLVVKVGEMFLLKDGFSTTLTTGNESLSVFIDSTTSYIILPLNICEEFEETFGLIWDENVQAYLVNDTLHSALEGGDTSVIFNLGNSTTIPGEGFNISLPYSAFDLTASAPLLNKPSRYFPLRRVANDGQLVLGRTFLQEAYLIADYERKNFSVSQCKWDGGLEEHIVAIKRPGDHTSSRTSHKLSAGAIAGIAIGAVVVIIAAVLLGIVFFKKRRRSEKPKKPAHIDILPVELDSPEKDPFAVRRDNLDKEHPQSPELDVTEHKGHELDGGLFSGQGSVTPEQRFELDATERRSRTLSSPISFLSDRSDQFRLHKRELSDPDSLKRERSDATKMHQRDLSDPESLKPHRSDATRLHKRELSDPVSLLSDRPDEGAGTL